MRCSIRFRSSFLALALLGAPAWHALAAGEEEAAAQFYEDALQRLEENDVAGAAIQIKNALQEVPGHRPSHLLLARMYLGEGEAEAAEITLLKARDLGVDESLTVLPLAEAYFLQRKYRDIIVGLRVTGHPADIQFRVLLYQAKAHLSLGEHDRASAAFERAAGLQPDSPEPLAGQALVALRNGKLERARELADAALVLGPEHAEAWFAKAAASHALGDVDSALEGYSRVVELKPRGLDARLARAGIYLKLDRRDEASDDLAYIRKEYPFEPRTVFLQSMLLSRHGDRVGARSLLAEAFGLLSKLPSALVKNDSSLQRLGGLAAHGLGENEQAAGFLESYLRKQPEDLGARRALGSVYLSRGSYRSAVDTVLPVLERLPDDVRSLRLVGSALARQNRHEAAITHLEHAVTVAEGDPHVRTQLAMSYLALGKRSRAIALLNEVISIDPSHRAGAVTLATLYIRDGDPEAARTVALGAMAERPKDVELLNLVATALVRLGNIPGGRETYEKIVSFDPQNIAARINLGKLDLMSGDYDAAERRYQNILTDRPDSGSTMVELAKIAKERGDIEGAIRWLEKALSVRSQHVATTVRLVETYLEADRFDDALRLAKEAETWAPDNQAILTALARSYLAVNKRDVAVALLKRLVGLAGYDAQRLRSIAEEQGRAGAWDDAAWALLKAVEGEPGLIAARVELVAVQLRLGRFEKAIENADRLKREAPHHPAGWGTRGEVYFAQGKLEKALSEYRQSLEKAETEQGAIRVFQVLARLDAPRASDWLEGWVKKHPGHLRVREALAERYAQSGRFEAARSQYEFLLRLRPRDPVLLANLGYVLHSSGEPGALDLLVRARALAPDDARINDSLGWTLVQTGDAKRGLIYLRTAHSLASQSSEIGYHIAVALESLGRTREARQELESVLSRKQSFKGREDAEKRLAGLTQD